MMRIRGVFLGIMLFGGAPAGAQQVPGPVNNPLTSPIFPDIVAFERSGTAGRELVFLSVASQRVVSSTAYAGQLDWRPAADSGRSWFAYVVDDDKGVTGLLLNYIDSLGLSRQYPLRIPFSGKARSLRWSPDGKHLAFIGDGSVLYIVSDVDAALRTRSTIALQATRITQASRPALFPAWSPFGDYIAYGAETVSSTGGRNNAIEVLPINRVTGKAVGNPVVVTSALPANNEYRPSWSPDGKYVAFYADQSGIADPQKQISIGIAEVIPDSGVGMPLQGMVREGQKQWLAENVIPDESRGPGWTSIADASQRAAAVLYVERQSDRTNVVMVARLQRWLDQAPREQYAAEISTLWGAPNPRWVSATEMNRAVRYVFTTVNGNGMVVGKYDGPADWAKGPNPLRVGDVATVASGAARTPPNAPPVAPPVPQPVTQAVTPPVTQPVTQSASPPVAPPTSTSKSVPAAPPPTKTVVVVRAHKGRDIGRALLFPGFGQFSAGSTKKGYTLLLAGIGGAGVAAVGFAGMSDPLSKAKAAQLSAVTTQTPENYTAQRAIFEKNDRLYNQKRNLATIGGGLFAAAYVIGVFDVSVRKQRDRRFSLQVLPGREPGSVGTIGLQVPFGKARR